MDTRHKDAYAAASQLEGRHVYRAAKRLFDIVFSACTLAILWWLYAIIAIAIKIDDPQGPVFFVQTRVGINGTLFRMYKFRSMSVDAEEQLEGLRDQNERDGPAFKMKDDPRVTRVGRFIRRTNFDELPQFVNVFFGQMSVVGPRPALPHEVETYTSYHRLRLLVKPGITCYWQIDPRRDELSFNEWVERDIHYMETCSLKTDIGLIVKTVFAILDGQGS